jgi:hypothetical protein
MKEPAPYFLILKKKKVMEKRRFLTMVLFIIAGSVLVYLAVSQVDFSPDPNTRIIISHPEILDDTPDTTFFYFQTLEKAQAYSNNMECSKLDFLIQKEVSIFYKDSLISKFRIQ